ADQWSELTLTSMNPGDGNSFMGPLVRVSKTATSRYELAKISPIGTGSPSLGLFKIVAGVQTQLGSIIIVTMNPGDKLKLAVQGSNLTCYINGVHLPALDFTDSDIATGFPGFFVQSNSVANVTSTLWAGGSVSIPSASSIAWVNRHHSFINKR
ncbi:MAG: hypothetical protein ACREQ5_11805, partial [Candidatus Dormibacteria bacterium]